MKLSLFASSIPFALLAACSSSSTTTAPLDAGGTVSDGASDVVTDGSVAVACAQTVVAACATASPTDCPYPTFDAARAAACCGSTCTVKVSAAPCGAYDVAELQGIDTVTRHYFDHASGGLVAIVRYGTTIIGYACGTGPAAFDAPKCAATSFVCVAGDDAGSDAAGD
jgi:hypothetical protein